MPKRPGKACRVSACSNVVTNNKYQGFCEEHKDKAGWFANEKIKGNRHQRGYGTAWDKLRQKVLNKDSHLCQPCKQKGKFTKATHVDHIKPKSKGGTNTLSNLQAICIECHKHKTATEK